MEQVIAAGNLILIYLDVVPGDESESEITKFQDLYMWPAIEKTYQIDLMRLPPEERYGVALRVIGGVGRHEEREKSKWSLGMPEGTEDFVAWMEDERTGKPVPVMEEPGEGRRKQVSPVSGKRAVGKRGEDNSVENDN